jgi:hypothetical protein
MSMEVYAPVMHMVPFIYGIVEHDDIVSTMVYFQILVYLLEARTEHRILEGSAVMIAFYQDLVTVEVIEDLDCFGCWDKCHITQYVDGVSGLDIFVPYADHF